MHVRSTTLRVRAAPLAVGHLLFVVARHSMKSSLSARVRAPRDVRLKERRPQPTRARARARALVLIESHDTDVALQSKRCSSSSERRRSSFRVAAAVAAAIVVVVAYYE